MKIFQTSTFWYTELQFAAILGGFALGLGGIATMTVIMSITVFALNPELLAAPESEVMAYFNAPGLQLAFLLLGSLCITMGGVLTAWLANGRERPNVRALMALWTYANALALPIWWDSPWWALLAGLLGPAAFTWIGAVPVEALRGRSIKP